MNILIPHHWLLDHLETQATPEQIRTQLSLAGPSVERVELKEGEPVYDIEITTNRVDSMSVYGIAREAAVILNYAQISAKLKPLDLPSIAEVKLETETLPLPEVINKTHVIKRAMAVVLTNISTKETPAWMAKRLKQIDQNVHWAAIDITNYVTHELGHPCHAFDYDKIMQLGGQIIIDEAKKDEVFQTLDEETYKTVGGEIVFRAKDGTIIDLPAIKGTANTAVDENTKNILFWIENMEPEKVRFTSMTHDIRTIAAQLNEKNVDPYLAEPTLVKGIELYRKLVGAKTASSIKDWFFKKTKPEEVVVPLDVFKRYLGFELPKETIVSILTQLGCQVTEEKSKLRVTPPTYRHDLSIPVDFVEEVARIYGYHNLPGKIMDGPLPLVRPKDDTFDLENKIRYFLSGMGLYEVYTYSLVSKELAEASGYPLKEHLKLANPLTDDKVYLKRSLMPSLAQVIKTNPTEKHLSVFEIAKVYHPQGEKTERPKEVIKLGFAFRQNWRQARGVLEALFDKLFIYNYQFIPTKNNLYAQIKVTQGKKQVDLGIIKPAKISFETKQAKTYQDETLYLAEIDILSLASVAQKHPQYKPLAKTTPIIEDLTFEVPETEKIGLVMETIHSSSPLINQVKLKDIYQNRYTFSIYYLDPEKNLSDMDVAPLRKQVVDTLVKKHRCRLVGNIT